MRVGEVVEGEVEGGLEGGMDSMVLLHAVYTTDKRQQRGSWRCLHERSERDRLLLPRTNADSFSFLSISSPDDTHLFNIAPDRSSLVTFDDALLIDPFSIIRSPRLPIPLSTNHHILLSLDGIAQWLGFATHALSHLFSTSFFAFRVSFGTMHPSNLRISFHLQMGWWGDMGGPTQRGITQYSVSPFQQNAMKGALHSYVFYGFKRIMQQAPYFVLPFGVGKLFFSESL